MSTTTPSYFRDRFWWYIGISLYWFGTSFKWFLLLGTLIVSHLSVVYPKSPGGEDPSSWMWPVILTIGASWATIGPSLFGAISDRYRPKYGRRKSYLIYGTLGTVGALIFLSYSNQFWMFLLGFFLTQVFDDLGTGPYSALIPEVIPKEYRGKSSSALGMLRLLANIFGGVAAIFAFGFTAQYLLVAAVQVVSLMVVLYLLRDYPDVGSPQQPDAHPKIFEGFFSPLKNQNFRIVWGITFLMTLGFYLINPYLVQYLKNVIQEFHFFGWYLFEKGENLERNAQSAYGVIGLLVSLAGAGGAVWAYRVSDRLGHAQAIIKVSPLMYLPILAMAFLPSYTAILLLCPVFGFAYGVFLSSSWALASDVIPTAGNEGKNMGMWQASWSSVQVFSGMLGLGIAYLNRSSSGAGYIAAFVVAGLLFAWGSALMKKVRLNPELSAD